MIHGRVRVRVSDSVLSTTWGQGAVVKSTALALTQ